MMIIHMPFKISDLPENDQFCGFEYNINISYHWSASKYLIICRIKVQQNSYIGIPTRFPSYRVVF